MYELKQSQSQLITFVMVDVSGNEVSGLGSGFTLEISKAGGAFAGSTGAKGEVGNGWYSYELSAGETDTIGPLSIRVTGAGAMQQNLEYIVSSRQISALEFTYTVTNSGTGLPIEGVDVWITTDIAGSNIIWVGTTNALGVARDSDGELPRLDPGTYYFWSQKSGFDFTNPDTEVVS